MTKITLHEPKKKRTLIPEGSECNICTGNLGSTRLVRDHDHDTGYIRGILCELCNSWLGVYESNLKSKQEKGRKDYKRWAINYRDRIKAHLKINTGILYVE